MLLVCGYPVIETLFSVYRRMLVLGIFFAGVRTKTHLYQSRK